MKKVKKKKSMCVCVRVKQRYEFIFFLFVPFDGDCVTIDGATAVTLVITDHRCQTPLFVCVRVKEFASIFPFTFTDICFYPCAFNFPFVVLQTQPTCILLLIDFCFFHGSSCYCCCVFFFLSSFLFILTSMPLLVACRTVYRFHSRSEESRYCTIKHCTP